jgi:hypothetical protein
MTTKIFITTGCSGIQLNAPAIALFRRHASSSIPCSFRPFDCVPTVSLSEFRASIFRENKFCSSAEAVEDTVDTQFIPFAVGTGLRVTSVNFIFQLSTLSVAL